MTPTLISRRGYILNTAEGAIAYLTRMRSREDLSSIQRFQVITALQTLEEGYRDAQEDAIALLCLADDILFQRKYGILQNL